MQVRQTKLAPQQVGSLVAPETAWVRLTRSGTKVAGYTSSDGVTWQQIGFADLPLTETVLAGLWVAGQAQNVGVTFQSATFGPVAEEPIDPGAGNGLPEPWQSVTLGTGTDSSSYATDTATFSLSAEGTGNGPTTHFVHQPVTDDSTLIARVQSLDAIDQAAAVGLMIRQGTSPESAYVFLALTPQGIRFESRRGRSTEVAHVAGPSASAPAWLKLERKGGSIYVYESGDGVNWQLVAAATLTLSNPLNAGMAVVVSNNAVRTIMQEVVLLQSSDEPLDEEHKTFDGVSPNIIEFPNGSAVAVGTGSLKSPTPITLKTFDNRPEGGAPRSNAIGLRTVVEVPFSQLDLSDPMTKSLFIYAPAFDGAYESADHPVQEVAISLDGGQEYVFLDSYIPDFPVVLTPAILEVVTSVLPNSSGTLRVSVQPIDAGDTLPGAPDPNDSGNSHDGGENSQMWPQLSLEAFQGTETLFELGLFQIPDDFNYTESVTGNNDYFILNQ